MEVIGWHDGQGSTAVGVVDGGTEAAIAVSAGGEGAKGREQVVLPLHDVTGPLQGPADEPEEVEVAELGGGVG